MPSAKDIFDNKLKRLASAEESLAAAVLKYQNSLYGLLASEYLPLFDVEDGVLANSPKNDRLIGQIDRYFDRLEKAMNRDILAPLFKGFLETAKLSAEYYNALGFKKAVVDKLLRDKIRLEAKLGVTPTGRLDKKGYLYRLGQTSQVRQELKEYVIKNLTGDTAFLDFQLGFRNLVVGNRRVKGLATQGALQRYFDQYAIDSFAQTDATVNKQFAHELQLKHFIYEGSLIKTSRAFCKKRAGEAFEVKETKTWKDDPDLIDKKTKDTYKPLIERGRYRCRHSIRYITEALYRELKGLPAKNKDNE